MTSIKALLLAGGVGLMAATSVAAESYRMAHFQPEGETTVRTAKWFAEALNEATDGEIAFELFSGGVLLPAKSSLQGIGDGVAQEGFHTSGYTPSELPLSNALSGSGYIVSDPTALGAAYADWVANDPEGQAEFAEHNVVPFGGFSTPGYPAICNTSEPITELDQLQGLKIRFPGGLTSKLAQDLSVIPVNIPATEIYQALQTGQIDCAGILAAWLNIDNSLDEVSNSVTLLNWEGSFNSPVQLYNKDFWQSLTDEQRGTIMELVAQAHARLQIDFLSSDEKALATSEEKGHAIVEPGESIQNAVQEWVDNGLGGRNELVKDVYGVEDPEALVASFQPYLDKWAGLIEGMEDPGNEEELTKVLYDNLYGQLDPATYGMD